MLWLFKFCLSLTVVILLQACGATGASGSLGSHPDVTPPPVGPTDELPVLPKPNGGFERRALVLNTHNNPDYGPEITYSGISN